MSFPSSLPSFEIVSEMNFYEILFSNGNSFKTFHYGNGSKVYNWNCKIVPFKIFDHKLLTKKNEFCLWNYTIISPVFLFGKMFHITEARKKYCKMFVIQNFRSQIKLFIFVLKWYCDGTSSKQFLCYHYKKGKWST